MIKSSRKVPEPTEDRAQSALMLARPLPFDRGTKTSQWREGVSAGGGETTGKPHTRQKKQLNSQMRRKFGAARGAGRRGDRWHSAWSCRLSAPLLPALGPGARRAQATGAWGYQTQGPGRAAARTLAHTENAAVGAAGVATGECRALRAGPGLQRFQGNEIPPKFNVLEK